VEKPDSLQMGSDLIEAIRAFPVCRVIEHCGVRIVIDPFVLYMDCPHCGNRIKVRSFAAVAEIEDIFDAVFEWTNQDGALEVANRRRSALSAGES
jgi:predicted RNA-binding Zn-ribbon protein involved in translation (DUF1610 family)